MAARRRCWRACTPSLTAAALVLSTVASPASSRLVAVAVLPHGDFAWDPRLANGSQLIHDASAALGADIGALAASALLVVSPHGVALGRDFGIAASSSAAGFAAVGGDLHNASAPITIVPFSTGLAANASLALAAALAAAGENASSILPWAGSEPFPLRWGEVIPLAFVPGLNGSSAPAVLVWSQPERRHDGAGVAMVPELLRVGALVFSLLDALPGDAVLLVSADLSHVHPSPVEPYGANETAADAFDGAVLRWAATGVARALVEDATSVAPWALSCGFTGLVMAQGAMAAAPGGASSWEPSLRGYAAPTYYGMMAALFSRRK